jgi:microcystin degradation protein MlrC
MRIGIVALLHESNTFSSQPTDLDHFRADLWVEGLAMRDALGDAHHEVGGFFAGLESLSSDTSIDVVPLWAARALPAGPITSDAGRELTRRMLALVQSALPLDGLLVALHGAAVCQSWPDADGHWLSVLRGQVGGTTPIVATLDLHANLSPLMVQCCHALIAYRTNPHLDQRQRGYQAARLLVDSLQQKVRPTMAAVFPPLAINIQKQCTDEPPLQAIYALADRQLQNPAVLSNSLLLGFPYADVAEMGAAAIAVTDNDPALAERLAAELGAELWRQRDDLRGELIGIEAALDQCETLSSGPICLLDMGDNVGGGSSADGTTLVAALLRRWPGPSFACIYDPGAVAACEAAGVGHRVPIAVGGKTDRLHGPPLELTVRVRSLHDGDFREDQPRHGGIVHFDQGRTAVVETDGELVLMLTSRRMVPFSLQQLVSCGLDPKRFRVLVAKGVNAPIAAYRQVCRHFIRVNTIGSTCADLAQLDFQHRRRPMYPFEMETDW